MKDSMIIFRTKNVSMCSLTYVFKSLELTEHTEVSSVICGMPGLWKIILSIDRRHWVPVQSQSCLTLCNPMDCSTPGFPVHHTRLPCPSPTPRACSNSYPSSRWCHPTISSSVVPFSSCLQSLPASGSFPVSQFFTSDGQSIGASASTSVLPMNIWDWFPLGWACWISLQSKGLSRVWRLIFTQIVWPSGGLCVPSLTRTSVP